jgi:tetratricopeptide (TPR) repeat protein
VIPLTEGVYCMSATQLQSVYRFAPGRWTEAYETAYRDLNRMFQQLKAADAATRQKMVEARGNAYWVEMISKFNGLRLSRLCAYLRTRKPEHQVGYSILIYRLTAQDIHDALFASPSEVGKDMGAVEELPQSPAVESLDVNACNDRAWTFATSPDAAQRNGAEAVALARRAVELSGGRDPAVLDTMAAAYAEAGRFPEAVETAQKALDLALSQKKAALADKLRARLALYQSGKPYHSVPRASNSVPQPSR